MVAALELDKQHQEPKNWSEEEEDWSDFLPDSCSEEESEKKVGYQDTDAEIDIPEDPYQVRTQRTFTNNPYNKGIISLALVGTGVFVAMQFVRFITGGYASVFNEGTDTPNLEQAAEESSSSILDSEPIAENTDNEDLEIHKALNEQSNEIKEIEEIARANSQETSSKPVESTATAPTSNPPTTPSPPARVVSYAPSPVVRPTTSIQPKQIQQPQRVEKKVAPVEQWLLAANMGSYGATSVNVQTVAQKGGSNGYQSGSSNNRANNLLLVARQRADSDSPQRTQGYSTLNADYSEAVNPSSVRKNERAPSKPALVGTQVEGEIEMPIIWLKGADDYNQQRNYLIRLGAALKGEQGEEIIPEGSLVVAKILELYGSTGLIQLEVRSVMLEKNGRTKEYQIPANSLMVLDRKGRILQAKAEKASQAKGEAAAFLLSGIGRAAAVLNNPAQTSYGAFGSSTVYGDGDPLSGFIEGATNSAVDSIEQRQALARSRAQGEPTVYVIEAGTKVQLLVNQSFNLSK